jgi:PUA-domain protein
MDLKIRNRHSLKSKDIKKIQQELLGNYGTSFFDKHSSVEVGEYENWKIIFINNEPCFIYINDRIIFTIYGLNKYQYKKKFVVVDMGAVKYITNGADVMGPGVVDADEDILENDIVWICDQTHHKPLAVGITQVDGEQLKKGQKGKVITNIHYVGDNLWKLGAKSL